ncbi:hypothetical protein TNCV_2261121 [Trichonephila clavipes]|nr:hypothetical protein TNCV_2261121 [Trichonephila clavipes]
MNKSPQSNFSLFAANNTKIPAYDVSCPKQLNNSIFLSEFLKGSKGIPKDKKDSKPLNWSSEAITAFQRCKQALADALLAHPFTFCPDYAILWTLSYSIGFLSRKLTSSEKSYNRRWYMLEAFHSVY